MLKIDHIEQNAYSYEVLLDGKYMKHLRSFSRINEESAPYEVEVRDILADLSDDGITYTYIEGSDIITGLWVDIKKEKNLVFRWIDVKHQVNHLISFFKEMGYSYDMRVYLLPLNYEVNSIFIDDLSKLMDYHKIESIRLRFDKVRRDRDVSF